jgi:hypothetical protein
MISVAAVGAFFDKTALDGSLGEPQERNLLRERRGFVNKHTHNTPAQGRIFGMNERNAFRTEPGFSKRSHGLAVLAGLCALASCLLLLSPSGSLASSATVYVEGVPGGVIVNTVEVSAKVIDIDQEKRVATLQAANGKTFTAKAGPKAVNFDKVSVGDMVNITLTEEFVVSVVEDGAPPVEASSAAAVTAPKGAEPGGIIAKTRQVVGTVTAIDMENRMVELQFSDGGTKPFPVREDIARTRPKVGEQVTFRLTETVAISVEKP